MSAEKRVQILSLLCEGNSIRGTSRLVGSQIRTVLKQLVAAGQECQAFLNAQHRGLKLRHVEIDEIWTFCQKKERRLGFFEKNDPELGDQYVFTALDQDSKLLVSFIVGKRNGETTQA
ncbi:MAG: IS1 family transposase, partial [Planctomycetaceae bacterium]|nr:IS1 family transposase [Planctomycetaceae bacterium]